MATFEDARLALKALLNNYEDKRLYQKGLLGNGDGATVDVEGQPQYTWVRIEDNPNKPVPVFNISTRSVYDLPVIIGESPEHPGLMQVLSVDWSLLIDRWEEAYIPSHRDTHMRSMDGDDPVDITWEHIIPLSVVATDPTSMRVVVQGPERYVWGKSFKTFNTTVSADMTARVPGAGTHRYVLISIDAPTNMLQYTDGTAVAIALPAVAPDVPSGAIPVSLIHLTNGDTTITNSMIYDYRTYINAVSDSGESPWPNVWIVAASGGDFAEPGDANDSADVAAGDVVWIMPGTYDGFTVTKNLTFIGLGDTAGDGVATGRVVISGLTTPLDIQAESSFQHIIFEDDDVTVNTADTVSIEHCRNADYNLTCGAYAVNVILKDSYWYDLSFGSATGGQLYVWHCDGGFSIDHGAAALYITASDYSAPIVGSGARYTAPDEHAEKTAATSTPVQVMDWVADSTGTPAAGFGLRHKFSLESSAGEGQDAAALDIQLSDPTSGSEDSYIRWLIRVAGAALAEAWRLNNSGVVLPFGFDFYPDGNEAGVQEREDCWIGWDEHFDVSALPAGWSWAADGAGDFTAGAPGTVSFVPNSLFQFGGNASTAAFCYRSVVATYAPSLHFAAMMCHRQLALNQVGIRIDDSGDPANHYVELYMDWVTGAGVRVVGRYNNGGGVTSVTQLTNQAPQTFLTLLLMTTGAVGNWGAQLSLGAAGGFEYGYVGGLGSGKVWTPDRVGVFIRSTSAGNRYAVVDAVKGNLTTW